MKLTWPIIGVKDVAASTKWYLSLLGQDQDRPATTTSRASKTMTVLCCSVCTNGAVTVRHRRYGVQATASPATARCYSCVWMTSTHRWSERVHSAVALKRTQRCLRAVQARMPSR
jgi:hypothetical protein